MVNTYLNAVEVHMYVDCLIQENVGLCTSSRNETIPVYESHILNFVIFQIKRCYMLTREALFLMCYTSRIVIIYWIFRFYWDSTRCLDWRLPRISGQSIITFNFRFHVCKLDPNFCSLLPLKISIRVCASFASVIILFISKRKFKFIPHPNVVKFPQFTPLMCLFLLCVQFCSSSSGSFLPIHRSVYRLKLLNDSKRKRLLLLLKLV